MQEMVAPTRNFQGFGGLGRQGRARAEARGSQDHGGHSARGFDFICA